MVEGVGVAGFCIYMTMGLANGSDVECENQRGKADSRACGLSIWMNGAAMLGRALRGRRFSWRVEGINKQKCWACST